MRLHDPESECLFDLDPRHLIYSWPCQNIPTHGSQLSLWSKPDTVLVKGRKEFDSSGRGVVSKGGHRGKGKMQRHSRERRVRAEKVKSFGSH